MSGRRIFRALLRMLPFDFRADYGRELERTFQEQQREAAGATGRARVWAENISALVAIGPREHFAQFVQDVRYGVRGMRRNPGYVSVAVLTLALGTGVNTTIFSIVHAVLLQPLPYDQPQRLVSVMNRWDGQSRAGLSDPEYLDYFERSQLIDIVALSPSSASIVGGTGDPARVPAVFATANLFTVLGRQPAHGRGFVPDDGRRGSTSVVISDRLWRSRFGGDPAAVGQSLNVNGVARTVIGILPPGFVTPVDIQGSTAVDVIAPASFDAAAPRVKRGGHYLTGIGRLGDGATVEAAAAEMHGIVESLIRQYPEEHNQGNFGVAVEPLSEVLLGDTRPVLWMLGGAVALVLVLACANVANLMLARGEARRREITVRAALGASRFRMARQFVTEALVLSILATGLGLLVAQWSFTLVVSAGPVSLPRLADASLSMPVLFFAAALAVFTTLLFGVLPAIQLSAADAGEALKDGARGGSAAGRAHVRRALVVCQVAVAVVLLVGAGLLLKSFARLLSVPSGMDASRVLTARVSVPPARYPGLSEVSGFFSRVLDRTRSLPGVEVAGASTGLPLALVSGDWGFDIEGRPRVNGRRPGRADWYVVTPGYFEALRIRLVAGRAPAESDIEGASPVIFLNESAASTLFPQGDAIGKRVRLSNTTGAEQPWRTVAGIVGDVRARGLDQQMRTEMFIPYRQFQHYLAGNQARAMTLVVRTSGQPEQLISALRGELRTIDPSIPLSDPRSMESVLSASVADRRLSLSLVGAFALLAIVLATVGVYGVVSYDALQRTREIGIRMALGASRQSVMAVMFGRGVRLVAAGAAIGLVAAGLLTRGFSKLLFEVSPWDVVVFTSVAALLVTVGALATFLPARRATRIDPLRALRVD